MIAYQAILVRVENVGEQNVKVSQVGGEGEVGSSIHPMWRRWIGEEYLPPHSTPDSSSPLEGSYLAMGGREQPKEEEGGKEKTTSLQKQKKNVHKGNYTKLHW